MRSFKFEKKYLLTELHKNLAAYCLQKNQFNAPHTSGFRIGNQYAECEKQQCSHLNLLTDNWKVF